MGRIINRNKRHPLSQGARKQRRRAAMREYPGFLARRYERPPMPGFFPTRLSSRSMPFAPIVTALPHRLLVTLALLLALDAQALTLGRVQGAALIGRPLDVVVQVQLDPGQSITDACFEADVFHADTRQNPAQVQVRLEPTATANAAVLRITSNSNVDEPVVTIYVRAGCAQMSSRRYVLLADIVSEQVAAVPRVESVPLVDGARMAGPSVAEAGATTPVATPNAVVRSADRSGAAVRSAATRQPRARSGSESQRQDRPQARRAAPARPAAAARNASRAQRPGRSAAAPVAAAPAAAPSAGQSRLQLDPLELLSERVATLETNANASTQPSEREARELERLDRLDASLKALLALAEKNEASLLDVRNRLEKSQTDRFGNAVVYGLLGLLLLSLLAIAYLLARINRGPATSGSRWFDAVSGSSDPDFVPPVPAARPLSGAMVDARSASSAPLATSAYSDPGARSTDPSRTDLPTIDPTQPMPQAGMVPDAGGAPAQVDVSLVEMSESTFDRLMQSGSVHSAVRRVHETVPMPVAGDDPVQGVAAMASPPRLNADDLIDIRQRAEFFVTLGQTDQAVQLLEARIAQDGASCPQAYLDLFQLFHSLGLKADFDQLRGDFARLFNARVPEFADFDDEGRSLEDYPGAVDRLIRLWSRPTVLDTLEQMVFARADAQADEDAFDLAAFRDLLMLHAVAQTVRSGGAGNSGAFGRFAAASGDGKQVDIDLSELFSPEAASTLIRPRTGAGAMAAAGSSTAGVDVDVPLDVDLPALTDTVQPTHNLIDFDLGDLDIPGKSGKLSS